MTTATLAGACLSPAGAQHVTRVMHSLSSSQRLAHAEPSHIPRQCSLTAITPQPGAPDAFEVSTQRQARGRTAGGHAHTILRRGAQLQQHVQVAQQQSAGGRRVVGRKLPDRAAPEAACAAEPPAGLGRRDRHVLGVDLGRAQRAPLGGLSVPTQCVARMLSATKTYGLKLLAWSPCHMLLTLISRQRC